MATREKLMTVEEFWAAYADKPYVLIGGRIVEVSPTGYKHGASTRRVAALLGDFVDEHGLGDVVGAETGFWLSEIDMKGADAAFICNEKLAFIIEPDKYLPFAPDLAVEVVSPSDSASDVQNKVALYLQAGTAIVWVIYPIQRTVVVHYPDNTAKTFGGDDTLDGGTILPGLAITVKALFPPPTTTKND